MKSFLRSHQRIVTYLAVGITCFSLQLVLLSALVHLAVDRPLANSVAFGISAQVNFLLSSKVTWGDRRAAGWRTIGGRWAAYNGTALLSLGCDSAVFVLTYRVLGTTASAALGVVSAACLTYLLCNKVVFRARGLAFGRRAMSAAAGPGDGPAR